MRRRPSFSLVLPIFDWMFQYLVESNGKEESVAVSIDDCGIIILFELFVCLIVEKYASLEDFSKVLEFVLKNTLFHTVSLRSWACM